MRHICPGKQAHHCKAQRIQKGKYVDATGIDRRKMLLPGEVSETTSSYTEKSAEAIVASGTRAVIERRRSHRASEGSNVELFIICKYMI